MTGRLRPGDKKEAVTDGIRLATPGAAEVRSTHLLRKGVMGVDGLPPWLIAAIRHRIDVLGQRMHRHPRHKAAWKQASELFEQLQKTFSEEQRRKFGEWEDHLALQESIEKEEMYVRGFLDGFHMYVYLDELIGQIPAGERFENAEKPHN